MPVAVVLSCQGSATRCGPFSSLPRLRGGGGGGGGCHGCAFVR